MQWSALTKMALLVGTVLLTGTCLASCSATPSGSAGPSEADDSTSSSSSDASPDAPAFNFSEEDLTNAFLSNQELTAAFGAPLEAAGDPPNVDRSAYFGQPSDFPHATAKCVAVVKQINSVQTAAYTGSEHATDSDGKQVYLQLYGFDSNENQRRVLAGYKTLAESCGELAQAKLTATSTTVLGGIGLGVQSAAQGNQECAVAGYGNVLISTCASTQAAADRIAKAERTKLGVIVTSR